jgi:hypothetical protein
VQVVLILGCGIAASATRRLAQNAIATLNNFRAGGTDTMGEALGVLSSLAFFWELQFDTKDLCGEFPC